MSDVPGARPRAAGLAVKRGVDVVLAALGLTIAAPVLLAAAVAVLVADGRPLFYRQARAGRDGHQFDLVKFRTMRVNDLAPEAMGRVTTTHPLVTRPGRWLRRTKVDELPQLVAVLRGHMSLVGPRPTLLDQAAGYSALERLRLGMRPGLTGWAQVNGNTALSWPERITLDVWYVHHWSLALDARIIARTVGVLVHGERPNGRALEEAAAHARHLDRSG